MLLLFTGRLKETDQAHVNIRRTDYPCEARSCALATMIKISSMLPSFHLPYPLTSKSLRHPPYSPFLAPSTKPFTSFPPFSATFSSSSLAFFSKSGRTFFPSSSARSLFFCTARASRSDTEAVSPRLVAASSAAARESRVGGGSGMCSSSGLAGDGMVGFREWGEAFRVDRMGLRCCL